MSLEESWIDVDQKVTVKNASSSPRSRYHARLPKVESLETETSALFYHAPSVYVIQSDDDEEEDEERNNSRDSPRSLHNSQHPAASMAALQDSLSTIVSRDMKGRPPRSKPPSSVCLDSLRIVPESQLPKMRRQTAEVALSATESDSVDEARAIRRRRIKRVKKETSPTPSIPPLFEVSPAALAAGITIIGLSFSAGYAIGRQSLRTASVN